MFRPKVLSLALFYSRLVFASETLPPNTAPLPIEAKDSWLDLRADSLVPLAKTGIEIVPGPQFEPKQGRADLFRYVDGRWRWRESRRFEPGHRSLPIVADRQAIFLRPALRPELYGWGECSAKRSICRVEWYRTIRLESTPVDGLLILLVGDESKIMEVATTPLQIEFIAAEEGLACAVNLQNEGVCAAISANLTKIRWANQTTRPVRILGFTKGCVGSHLLAQIPGRATTLPRHIKSQSTCAGRWMTIEIDSVAENVVIDVISAEYATHRLAAVSLALPPNSTEVLSTAERGLRLKPFFKTKTKDVSPEAGARLVFFGTDSPASQLVPVAMTEIDPDGWAYVPSLGSGLYRMKLFSRLSDREAVDASLSVGIPAALRFGMGIPVRGRVRLVAPSPPLSPATISLQKEMEFADVIGVDLAAAVITTQADVDGAFELAVPGPGKYLLLATWGQSRSRRSVEIADDAKEVEIPDIVLSGGTTVRGRVEGCASSGLRWAKLPEGERIALPQFIVVPVDSAGNFLVEGLEEGNWYVMASCNDQLQAVTPATLKIPAETFLIVDFLVE